MKLDGDDQLSGEVIFLGSIEIALQAAIIFADD